MQEQRRIHEEVYILTEKIDEIREYCDHIHTLCDASDTSLKSIMEQIVKKKAPAEKIPFLPIPSISPDPDERFISPRNFYLQTQICLPGTILNLFKRDPQFFNTCGKKEGCRYYLKKEATIQFLKNYSEGRLLESTIQYLRKRESQCQH